MIEYMVIIDIGDFFKCFIYSTEIESWKRLGEKKGAKPTTHT